MTIFSFFRKAKQRYGQKNKSLLQSIDRVTNPETLWEIVSDLGDGAFGKVYKVQKRESNLMAALKTVDFDSEEELYDFLVEIDILKNFKHENILYLHEVYVFGNKLWMFLELCGGGALDSIMQTLEKPLSEPQIRFVARDVLRGLKFLHENFIIHRDLKAGNILITSEYGIKIADFGVSIKLANINQMTDQFIGTPYWMAPEVIQCEMFKGTPYNWKADIWSFGITLLELAEKLPPNNVLNPTRVLTKILKSPPPSLSKPVAWSTDFVDFLKLCLQKEPSDRAECEQLLKDSFVANVTEKDRKQIRLLIGEIKADVFDVMDVDAESHDLDEVSMNQITEPIVSHVINGTKVADNGENNGNNKAVETVTNDCGIVVNEVNEKGDTSISNEQQPLSREAKSNNEVPATPQRKMYRTMTRTRRFVVDGQVMTTTAKRVVSVSPDVSKFEDSKQVKRKVALRAFRALARQEDRLVLELGERAKQQTDLLESRLNNETTAFVKLYEQKLDTSIKAFKAQQDRLAKDRDNEMNALHTEILKDQQSFKNRIKHEINMLDRANRKSLKSQLKTLFSPDPSAFTSTVNSNDSGKSAQSELSERMSTFREDLNDRVKKQNYLIMTDYDRKLSDLKRAHMNERQVIHLDFDRENRAIKQRHITMRYQLNRANAIDLFVIKRSQLTALCNVELIEIRQSTNIERTHLETAHAYELRNLQKSARRGNRLFDRHFRNSIVFDHQSKNLEQSNVDNKSYDESISQLEVLHRTQREDLEKTIKVKLNDLEQGHAERRNALISQEMNHLDELHKRYMNELHIFDRSTVKSQLEMESEFNTELRKGSNNSLKRHSIKTGVMSLCKSMSNLSFIQ